MKKKNLPLTLIISSIILIILNFISTSDEMDIGLWMRILSSVLLILAMYIAIKDKAKGDDRPGLK